MIATKEDWRRTGTTNCRSKKCNTNDCNKRGLKKLHQWWQSCITTDYYY
jgi:hypothetical protein